ncbi:MAG: N-acetylmuramoyl-L-alanine amidase [Treponema sp.]|jgi:N-acetylmuramoyl-L-alanine amidase|nr:N-acetylmuramoyl-L-alanine amidase [Treponema sp.]
MRLRIVFVITLLFVFFSSAQAQDGRTYSGKSFSLDETLKELGVTLSWDPLFASGILYKGENRLKFYSGSPGEQGLVLINSQEIISITLPYVEKGNLRFPEAFLNTAKGAFLPPAPGLTPVDDHHFRIAAIIIDPGHGGRDPGAEATHTITGKTVKLREKDITLSVASKLSAFLNAAYPGKKILLTRTGDTYPSLESRVNIANTVPLKDNEAIIYVSIHANASRSVNARGYEVWYLPPETERELVDREKYAGISHIINDMLQAEFLSESTRIGRFILNRFREALGSRIPSRGLKAENFYVVRNARMPAVLVELGFLSNIEDAKLLIDEEYLKLFAESLYKGIADFVTEFERSGGYTASNR